MGQLKLVRLRCPENHMNLQQVEAWATELWKKDAWKSALDEVSKLQCNLQLIFLEFVRTGAGKLASWSLRYSAKKHGENMQN